MGIDETNLLHISPVSLAIQNCITQYESSIKRTLTEESKERIRIVLERLVDDGEYFPNGYTKFQVCGRGEHGLVFFTGKQSTVVKIPIEWKNGQTTSMDGARRESLNHETFFYGVWGTYEFCNDKKIFPDEIITEKSFRVPIYYQTPSQEVINMHGSIIMEKVQGRSIYYHGLMKYCREKFPVTFEKLKEKISNTRNDDELASLFQIDNIAKFIEDALGEKKMSLDYESLTEDLFGKNIRDAIMGFLYKLRKMGFEHGDIHPGNIMIELEPNTGKVEKIYLIDFGKSSYTHQGKGFSNDGKNYWQKNEGMI